MNRRVFLISTPKESQLVSREMDGVLIVKEAETFLHFFANNIKMKLRSRTMFEIIKKRLNIHYELMYKDSNVKEECLNEMDEMNKTSRRKYYKSYEAIRVSGESLDECIDFIKKNKSLFKGKSVILPDFYKLDEEDYKKAKRTYEAYKKVLPKNKIELKIEDCILTYSLEEYIKSYEIIDKIVKLIKSLDLSPLEQIAIAYDIVKKRKFQVEGEEENAYSSRDLIGSLLGENIVCVGYVGIFCCILRRLGFKPIRTFMMPEGAPEKNCHIATIVNVDDPKYDVKGHAYFDPCSDCSKDDSLAYINNYDFFLRPLNDMLSITLANNLELKTMKFLYPAFVNKLIDELPDDYSYLDLEKYFDPRIFNDFMREFGFEPLNIDFKSNSKKELIDLLRRVNESFIKPIKLESFVELIYNVKKIEYYLNPNESAFSIDDIKEAINVARYNTHYIDEKTLENNNLKDIDLEEYFKNAREELFNRTLTEEKEREIAAIKLTRTLRSHLINNNIEKE